jgi:hypothetical protein
MPRDPDDEDLVGEEWSPEYDSDYQEYDEEEIIEEDHDGLEDEILTVECPACGAEVIADVGKCPCCGEYLADLDRVWTGRSWWWIALGLAGIGAVIYSLSGAGWMM